MLSIALDPPSSTEFPPMTQSLLFRVLLLPIALLLLALVPARAQNAAPPPSSPGEQVVGVWSGTTRAGCNVDSIATRCNALQKVEITLQKDEKGELTGFYKCAYGNQNCYDLNERGKVVNASLTAKQLFARVQMPDGSSCIF